MFKASLLIVLVGACLASAGLLSRKPTVSSEFKKINEWLIQNVPDNTDGFANVRKAAEYLASAKSSMSQKEQDAWEVFAGLALVENKCSVEGAKLIHRNFEQAALPWPVYEEAPKTRINSVLLDVQEKTLARCSNEYHKMVKANYPLQGAADSAREFLRYWQNYHHNQWETSSLYPERKYFDSAIAKQGNTWMAKLLYNAIANNRADGTANMVELKLNERTGKKEPVSVETAKRFLRIFFDECQKLNASLGNTLDLMMISEEDTFVRDLWRELKVCQAVTENYQPDKLAKTLVKISMNEFDVPE